MIALILLRKKCELFKEGIMKQKNNIKGCIAILTLVALVTSTFQGYADAKTVVNAKLNKTRLSITKGSSSILKVNGKKIKSVLWKTNNKKIVTLKKKTLKSVKVTAKKKGTTKIRATVKFNNKKKKNLTCKVTVREEEKLTTQNPSLTDLTKVATVTNTPVQNTPAPVTNIPSATDAGVTNTTSPNLNEPTVKPTVQPLETLTEDEMAECSYPMLFSDIPDPYICRKDDTYYMISTTMFLNPGAPIMKSTDLVHWQMAGYVYDIIEDDDYGNMDNGKDMYSHGSWAASIAYNKDDNLFYVSFNTANEGCFFYTTESIESGNWKKYKSDSAYHDSGMLFEEGKLYMYATYGQCDFAQVRLEEDNDGDGVGKAIRVGEKKTIIKSEAFSGTEGWHIYHIGDYYYLLSIGSPNGKWYRTEICYRSKTIDFEDYEEQVVYSGPSGGYTAQGLAQGGIIDTVYGEWYGYLFQDHESIGRCPSVVEVNWDYTDKDGKNYKDWPILGTHDKNGVFQASVSEDPIKIHLKDSGLDNYIWGDDDFNYKEGEPLKLIWQWNHNPEPENWSLTEKPGYYRIRSGRLASNVYGAKNSLTQRTYGPKCSSETKINIAGLKPGDYAGLCAFQDTYGLVGVVCDKDGKKYVVQGTGKFNEQTDGFYEKVPITENERLSEALTADEVCFKVSYDFSYTQNSIKDLVDFYYSLDNGATWNSVGKQLKLTNNYQTVFMGARSYLFMYSTNQTGGYADFDYYKIYD